MRIALVPRDVCALIDDAIVPEESEPLQSLEDRARARVGAASLVGILDAEKEFPSELAGIEPVEERGSRATDVQVSRRRGCEAKARFGAVCHQ